MADVTRRFRASTSVPYVHALVEIVSFAREHPDAQFQAGEFGGNVGAFVHNGLTVSGPEAVVDQLTDLIERAGLTEVDA